MTTTIQEHQIMTLGELTLRLERCDQTKPVAFDFGSLGPTELMSWRGIYAELAIGYSDNAYPTVAEFLAKLREADGKTFEGYKGGDYTMGRRTPLHVANYGHSGSTAIVGVEDDGWAVMLVTARVES